MRQGKKDDSGNDSGEGESRRAELEGSRSICKWKHGGDASRNRRMGGREGKGGVFANRGDFNARTGEEGGMGEEEMVEGRRKKEGGGRKMGK